VLVCFYSDLPPSQGGKYVGFGSSPAPSNDSGGSGKSIY